MGTLLQEARARSVGILRMRGVALSRRHRVIFISSGPIRLAFGRCRLLHLLVAGPDIMLSERIVVHRI